MANEFDSRYEQLPVEDDIVVGGGRYAVALSAIHRAITGGSGGGGDGASLEQIRLLLYAVRDEIKASGINNKIEITTLLNTVETSLNQAIASGNTSVVNQLLGKLEEIRSSITAAGGVFPNVFSKFVTVDLQANSGYQTLLNISGKKGVIYIAYATHSRSNAGMRITLDGVVVYHQFSNTFSSGSSGEVGGALGLINDSCIVTSYKMGTGDITDLVKAPGAIASGTVPGTSGNNISRPEKIALYPNSALIDETMKYSTPAFLNSPVTFNNSLLIEVINRDGFQQKIFAEYNFATV